MSKILVVEDDQNLREELKQFLKNNAYEVSLITKFDNTLAQIQASHCDLILLDINIPGVNGEYLCKEIRKTSQIPIMIVTSRDNEIDELLCMNYGADDYITKPYNAQILLARMERILKRMNGDHTLLPYHQIQLNVSRSVIETDEGPVDLSKNEMKIFYFLLKNRGHIVGREEIMSYLWDTEEFIDDNTLTVNINRLRKKLEEIGLVDVIETKRGQGYIIE